MNAVTDSDLVMICLVMLARASVLAKVTLVISGTRVGSSEREGVRSQLVS